MSVRRLHATMSSKHTALADYILCLSESASHTHHANDRPLYQMYLAHAGLLLALFVRSASASEIDAQLERHERLWGQTFLAGPEHVAIRESWDRFRSTS